MNFLAPEALWFAATIPVVIVFYLLKRKRTVRLISSTVLWQRFLAETRASAPFQKLRRNWLLFLQILLLILAVLALARPYFSGQLAGGRLHVVILDASASMQSTDVTPSRFEEARSGALKLVDAMRETDQMIVLQAAANAEVKQSATGEKASLRRALRECAVTDSTTRLIEALKMAESLTRDNDQAEIHLFSDGIAPGLEELKDRGLPLTYHQVGSQSKNLGIVGLDVRPNPESLDQRAIFTTIANADLEDRGSEVELRFNDQLVETRYVNVPATNSASLVFLAEQRRDGVFTVSLTAEDEMSVDNRASVVSRLTEPIEILLISAGNAFLEKALRAAGPVRLTVQRTLSTADPFFDLVILDTPEPTVWPNVNILAIRPATPRGITMTGTLTEPPIVDWRITHPLLRFVNFDNVLIGQALQVETPPWATALVESPQSPLLFAGELGAQRVVWVGFDLLESTWPLRVSFPIFMANAVNYLNPRTIETGQLLVQAGHPFRLPLLEPRETATVARPDGSVDSLVLDTAVPELIYGRTAQTGVYELSLGTNQITFCVNLLDPLETANRPQDGIDFGKFGRIEATTARPASLEMWRWFVIIALAVLLLEWWYYHRRTA